jgi:hypothetical protein
MNNADDNFGELLRGCSFDDSIRDEHRREVRARALQAFDEAAAARAHVVVIDRSASKRWTKRQIVRRSLAMAVAASLLWGLIPWRQTPGPPIEPGEERIGLAEARAKAREAANDPAIDLLGEFSDEEAALTFAQGIDVCVRERDGRLATIEDELAGQGS